MAGERQERVSTEWYVLHTIHLDNGKKEKHKDHLWCNQKIL